MRVFILLLSLTFFITPLVSAKQKGDIKVLCESGCKIYLDNEYKGKPKRRKKSFVIKDVSFGNHIIKYVQKGMKSDTIYITLSDPLLEVDVSEIAFERNVIDIKAGTQSEKYDYDRFEYKRRMNLEADSTILGAEESSEFPGSISGKFMPYMIEHFFPEFPDNLRTARKSGVLWIKALVGPKGNVLKAQVGKKSKYKEFDYSAKITALKDRYMPAVVNDKRVAVWVTFKVVFEVK